MSGRIWKVAILASAVILAATTGQGNAQIQQTSRTTPSAAAIVNGETITLGEVDRIIRQRVPTTPDGIPLTGDKPVSETQRQQMRFDVLGMLIDDLLLQQFLAKNGPKVNQADIDKYLANLEAGLKNQKKTKQDFMKETQQSEAQIKNNVVTLLQWVEFAKGKLNDEALQRYFTDNKEFFDQVTVRASHVVLRIAANASEKDKQAAQAKLKALRQEILAGKIVFADAAKKYSECVTAPQGGDLGYFPRKFVVQEPFARAAFAMQANQISEVVETDYGYHLILVTDRKAGTPAAYEKIKEEVKEIAAEEMRHAIVAQQRTAAKVQINLAVPKQEKP